MRLDPGTRLGHYEVISLLGKGGMGEVYLAQDMRLGRRVALRALPAAIADDQDSLARFIREARAASALNHPNIITIHDIGDAAGTHFIAYEFVDGTTLRDAPEALRSTPRQGSARCSIACACPARCYQPPLKLRRSAGASAKAEALAKAERIHGHEERYDDVVR